MAIRPFDPAEQAKQTTSEAIACRWMARQVRKRLGLDGLFWPYWVWATPIDEVLGFLDMTSPAQLSSEACVVLHLQVPERRILLSQFSMWECAMVGSAIPLNELENESFGELDLDSDCRTIVRTWPRMFELGVYSSVGDAMTCGVRLIQGCVPHLLASDVERAEQF